MKRLILSLILLPALNLCAQEKNPAVPENFPRFQIEGQNDLAEAIRELYWHHYPGAGPMSTFEDGWLATPSLWPNTDKAQTNRERWRQALLERKIDDEGYVTTLQHAGFAHADGWPFPLHSQGGGGWVFSRIHAAFYDEKYGVHFSTSLEGFELSGLQDDGIDEASGQKLKITDAQATLISPKCKIDTEAVSLIRLDWGVDGLNPNTSATMEWVTEQEPEFSPERQMKIPLPANGEQTYTHLFANKNPKWRGTVTRLRITVENGAGGSMNFRSWITTFDSRHVVNQPCFIKGCFDYVQWTGDVDFLGKNMNRMRKALAYSLKEFEIEKYHCVRVPWAGHDGRPGFSYDADGKRVQHIGRGIGGNYWDIMPFGGRDCLATIYHYDAFLKMAELEEAILKHPEWDVPDGADKISPERLRELAKMLKDNNEMFWNKETGRFVAAIDVDDVRYDFGFTFVNNEAIYYGYANDEQAKTILSWLNGDRIVEGDTSQGADIYFWRFGPRATTKRNLDYYFWAWSGAATIPFGDQVQDGGAVLGFAFHDLMARIQYLGPDNAEKRLRETAQWFREVQDEGGYRKYYTPEKKRGNLQGGNIPGGLGLDLEFFESVLYPQVMLFGFMGFEPKIDGFSFDPKLPEDWPNLIIDNIHWQDLTLKLKATKGTMEIEISYDGPERPDGRTSVNFEIIPKGEGEGKWQPVPNNTPTRILRFVKID